MTAVLVWCEYGPMAGIAEVWSRIEQHQGEVFTQIRGGEFTYAVDGRNLKLDRTNWFIRRADIEQALDLVPLRNTVVVSHLNAPSYIYAILMDGRIRQQDW